MKKITKAAVALATVGGALMMVAPAAFADTSLHVSYNGGVSAAGSMQWQNGTDSSGTVLDQSSSVSAGSLSAETYSSTSNNNGGYGSSTTYTVNPDGTSTTAQQSSYTNNGGNSSLSATDYSSTGSSVTQSQTQNISSADNAEGGTQGQVALSISGNGNLCVDTEFGSMTLSVTGVGVALNSQTQNGNEAYGTQMNSTANLQTSNTSADWLKSSTYSAGSSTATTTYTAGKPSSQSSTVNHASSTTTSMTDMTNPTASLSQDQNQIIGYDSQGGVQSQTGAAGVLPGTLWVSVGNGD